jgi:hypothetical protein
MQNRSNDLQGISMSEAMKLAQSDAGKNMLAQLQKIHGSTMQKAMEQAQTGNMEQVKQTLSSLPASPEGKELMDIIRRQQNG